MRIIADLHIHSKYSRACSKDLVLEGIDEMCRVKGVDVVGTGDFTHPEWFREMKEKLVEEEEGLYVLKDKYQISNVKLNSNDKFQMGNGKWQKAKNKLVSEYQCFSETRFICSAEISCIYSKGGKCRRLHIVVLAPSLEVVEKINLVLGKIGNLKADGRPILGLDAKDLAQIVLDIDERCMIIPAHIWTPWFAMFGSKSGFDSIEECFEELTPEIYAVETGLSSDPVMNWRVKNLDKVSIVSNSDAHSLPNIGREANVLEIITTPSASLCSATTPPSKGGDRKDEANVLEIDKNLSQPPLHKGRSVSYDEICRIIKEKKLNEFLYTIEFYPEEGMYHVDGHRACGFACNPKESKRLKNICPICRKPLTIGVLNRAEELAEIERGEAYGDKNRVPFKKLVGLDKIIAEALGVKSRNSKQVQKEYENLIKNFGSEFNILLNVSIKEIAKNSLEEIGEGVRRVRAGKLFVEPGFDGQYGVVKIFSDKERKKYQEKLF